ncbi:unnamed protein product [Chrysoparadoxa australica]
MRVEAPSGWWNDIIQDFQKHHGDDWAALVYQARKDDASVWAVPHSLAMTVAFASLLSPSSELQEKAGFWYFYTAAMLGSALISTVGVLSATTNFALWNSVPPVLIQGVAARKKHMPLRPNYLFGVSGALLSAAAFVGAGAVHDTPVMWAVMALEVVLFLCACLKLKLHWNDMRAQVDAVVDAQVDEVVDNQPPTDRDMQVNEAVSDQRATGSGT